MLSEHDDAVGSRLETAGMSAITDRLLTAAEIAELLAVPERWVREHTRGGLIPHVKLGRYVRYRRIAVLDWLIEQDQEGAAWRRHHPRALRASDSH